TPEDIEQFYKQKQQQRAFAPITLKLKLTEEEIARFAVDRYRFPGVDVQATLIRYYPQGQLLSHVLGYIARINTQEYTQAEKNNYTANDFIGKSGIEKFYEKILRGKMGSEQVEMDASGRSVRTYHGTSPVPGNNIYLTIDSELSKVAMEALGTDKGSLVAIDPNSGEILTIVSNPGYDPNAFVQGISNKDYQVLLKHPDHPLYNRTIRGQYPMASTIKPFYATQGLDTGTVDLNFRVYDPGYYRLPGGSHVYHNWKHSGQGSVNIFRAIIVSNDTFFFTLAHMMGITKMDDILTRYGFGHLTNIDLPDELPGLVASPAWKEKARHDRWYPGDTINAGIGQGFMLTTPVQLAAGVATIASRGKRYQIHLLKSQVTPDAVQHPEKITSLTPLILHSTSTWNTVIDAMKQVIASPEGTAHHKFGTDTPYVAAAKTGTAQVYSAKSAAQLKSVSASKNLRDHSLFIVFAPADKPVIAVAVIVENNKLLAAHAARKFLDYYFARLGMKGTQNVNSDLSNQPEINPE
ncbi:MAG: penicillin-binding protein 2, partial [Proteobacteria bacterium]|nr:penicillin-binding protein 2 [Pseudomonadota bacterium]